MKKFAMLMAFCMSLTSLVACGKEEEPEKKQELDIVASETKLGSKNDAEAPETPEASSEEDVELNTVVDEEREEAETNHTKIFVDKNTDIDLSVIKIGDFTYDFGTMTVGELLEATDTRELGFYTLSMQKGDFNCHASGFGRFAETTTLPSGLETPDYSSYGSVYALEWKVGDDWHVDLKEDNRGSAEIVAFATGDVGDDFKLEFANGLIWEEEMPVETLKSVLGEGTVVGRDEYIAYCDGDTILLADLEMFEPDKVDNIYVYKNVTE